ncbi:cytochrome c biogenesis CcdA family protein [Pseudaestuariivita rosea]|uniref:cytochrome c biogenesis CcdA family protein n=1 Tax=Pseudaestuariivita rosea TaxID=2763263 RepID=UPI001ABAD807|nr:cytochrome c biogenesis CcdA family protein [Pseudaestuariivita rosea]
MELLFGYGAGLLTLINPCVLPVLPIVLATALQADRRGPIALAAGMSVAFVILGVTVAAFGRVLGIDDTTISSVGAALMIGFGLILLVPRFATGFATATAGFADKADAGMDQIDRSGLKGQFLAGMLLGAVWSPCIGPTLGGAISMASKGESLGWATAIMVSFAMGVSTIILALGYGARSALQKRQATMRAIAAKSRPIMGIIFIVVGVVMLSGAFKIVEIWLLDTMPIWLQDLSVAL